MIENVWDQVNAIAYQGGLSAAPNVWIVQTFDYHVIATGLTEFEAKEKAKAINSMELEKRRQFIKNRKSWSFYIDTSQRERLANKVKAMLAWAKSADARYVPLGVHIDALRSLAPWIEQVGATSVLDCASGPCPGPLAKLMAERGVVVTGLDLLPEADIVGDVHDLPFGDATFDLVMSRKGPEHFLIPYLAIHEMMRVSRGWLIICLPSDSPHCGQSPGHLYVMGKQGWENVFRRLGLRTVAFEEIDITETDGWEQAEWRWLLRKAE